MATPRLFLAPGASGTVEGLARHVAGLARRGVAVETVALPRGKAARAVDVYRRAIAGDAAATIGIGGHSFGGRVASLLAAEQPVGALVLLSYPLHAPGRHDAWDERTAHWPRIECPTLLLSGRSDPFARIDLLERAAKRLLDAELVTYPGVGHGLGGVLEPALDEVARFLARHG